MSHIQPVKNDERLQRQLQRIMQDCVTEDYRHLSLDWLEKRGWFAIPIEYPPPVSSTNMIAMAAQQYGVERAHMYWLPITDSIYTMPLHSDALQQMCTDFSLRYLFVMPENEEFALFSEGDFYMLLAGPMQFIELLKERAIVYVKEAFEFYINDTSSQFHPSKDVMPNMYQAFRYYNDDHLSEGDRKLLTRTHDRYWNFYKENHKR